VSDFDLSRIIKAYDVRGIVPDQFSARVAEAVGVAFARVVVAPEGASRVVVGRDMRDSGPDLVAGFARGVTSQGVDVLDVGMCSTDGLYFASGHLDAPGVMFTASHNPAAYNGMKLCRAGARPVGQDTGLAEIREMAQRLLDDAGDDGALDGGEDAGPAARGSVSRRDLLGDYAGFLRSLVDLSGMRPLKVVVDAGNGMAGLTVPAVLGDAAGLAGLPLDVVPMYFELDGTFPNHEANPLEPANLLDLQAAVVAHEADLGLAFDGDADRCFVVDETGAAVSPSAVTALVGLREVAREKAAGRSATLIANLITSRAVTDLLGAEADVVRTRVGHSFIKQTMADHGAVFGGEHSAHYYFRDFWYADTGMLAALHVLAALGSQPHPASALADMYTPYTASGEINSTVSDAAAVTDHVRATYQAAYPDAVVDTLDGLTITHWDGHHPKWWFNLRASNTEPLLRLNVEAADHDIMTKLRDDVLSLVRKEDA